jgi:erythromycin esterase-like protein
MSTEFVTLQLLIDLYQKLRSLAAERQTDLVEVIAHLVTDAQRQTAWLQDLAALRQQIQADGGLQLGDREERVEQLRQTRQEIFDAEYAHLYR